MSTRRTFLTQLAAGAVSYQLWQPPSGSWLVAAEPQSSRPKIKLGQIGVGHGHATKLSVYRASADYEVVGIVESDERLRADASRQPAFRDLPWLTTEQLLNTPGLQAVLVETRVSDLLAAAELCIAAGKHIHLDKPAGADLAQFRQILATAERQQLLVQLGYMYRYNPGILLLRQLVQDGWLGEIFEVHTVMSKVVDADDRRDLAQFAGGIMFELGCHVIDLVVGLLGKPTRVTPHHRQLSDAQDTLRDNMLAVLEYPRALATVKSTALEVEGFARRQLTVCGTQGTFHLQPLDDPAVRLALDRPRGSYHRGYQDIAFPPFTRYVGDAADMAAIIRGDKAADFSYAHELDVQETVLAASDMLRR